jgi:hypothetical protein
VHQTTGSVSLVAPTHDNHCSKIEDIEIDFALNSSQNIVQLCVPYLTYHHLPLGPHACVLTPW